METLQNTILLVDDDSALLELLAEYLQGDGFAVVTANSAAEALSCLDSSEQVDAMVLDIMMPGKSGLDLLKELRKDSELPVIMLTGRGDDIDRIVGLELGADDYIGKPCNPRELSARIKAVLRRTKPNASAESDITIKVGGLALDKSRLKALVGQHVVALTATEFRILAFLAEHLGQSISKEILTEQILNRKLSPYDRSMDVHISRIRQKLAEYQEAQVSIQSIRSVGYLLSVETSS